MTRATLEDIVRRYHVDRVELESWVSLQWVKPVQTPKGPQFDEVDAARVGLIRELRRDLMVEQEALGLILSLLDQLYAARQVLRSVEDAVEALPAPLQDEVRRHLRRPPER